MSFLVYPTIKMSPVLGLQGSGGGLGFLTGSVVPPTTYTMTKSSSHDSWKEGSGLQATGACPNSNSTGVSHSSNTTVTMTLSFSPTISTPITEFKMCIGNAGSNGFTIYYRFNGTGGYSSTGVSSSGGNVKDLTSEAQATGGVTDFQLQGGGGSGNTHMYLQYLKVNGAYFTGNSVTTFTATF